MKKFLQNKCETINKTKQKSPRLGMKVKDQIRRIGFTSAERIIQPQNNQLKVGEIPIFFP